ncbi:uncharacterized protein G2W53_027382 [Senna tora]|uniref:Uncharacterized protein n=1 Tax=Senna tora TaxID=362788 RepID=A0A834TIL7_9FABA|nr:uncharacterized protein G2W53_027382 [Senna tora]
MATSCLVLTKKTLTYISGDTRNRRH